MRYIPGHVKSKLESSVRKNKRRTLYKMLSKKHNGKVPCYVCGNHVNEDDVTLEHIIPKSKGGSDNMENLSISHKICNERRGNIDDYRYN